MDGDGIVAKDVVVDCDRSVSINCPPTILNQGVVKDNRRIVEFNTTPIANRRGGGGAITIGVTAVAVILKGCEHHSVASSA